MGSAKNLGQNLDQNLGQNLDRYARQSIFNKIGKDGQKKLQESKVTIIGVGALGTVSVNNLCRAGIGHLRFVDRDYVELTNLQRQVIFTENDAKERLPKAIAAYNYLSKVNSEITLEPIVSDVNPGNVEDLVKDSDLVLDATDNFEIRLLLNEACHKNKIPWIYGGALGSIGMTLNILGEDGPCLACFMNENSGSSHTCSTFGVMSMVTNVVSSIQSAEAIKILLKSEDVRKNMLSIDLWGNSYDTVELSKNEDCPVCVHGKYPRLTERKGAYTTSICATDSIQVVPTRPIKPDFVMLAERLKKVGEVRQNPYTLTFSDDKYEFVLFQDGRAMIKNAIDENNAKSVYMEYIGMQ